MSDLKLRLLGAGLAVLAGAALLRLFGAPPAPIVGLGLMAVLSAYRVRRRKKRIEIAALLAELRVQEPAERERTLAAIESESLREQLAAELAKEGAARQDGDVERFPFPASFRRRVTIRYWRNWCLAAVALAVAAFLPALTVPWRIGWLAVGLLYLYSLRGLSRLQRALLTVIEISPFRVSEVWPDGSRRTLLFARGLALDDRPRHRDLLIRPRDQTLGISLSYYRLEFNRLAEIVAKYGGFGEVVAAGDDT